MISAAGIEQDLQSSGCETLGPIDTVREAIELIRSGENFHAATVDHNFHGQESWPVIEALRERGIPFALATGYTDFAGAQVDAPVLEKP